MKGDRRIECGPGCAQAGGTDDASNFVCRTPDGANHNDHDHGDR
jgi:hypothetical protein